jgi:hypothetical protein
MTAATMTNAPETLRSGLQGQLLRPFIPVLGIMMQCEKSKMLDWY